MAQYAPSLILLAFALVAMSMVIITAVAAHKDEHSSMAMAYVFLAGVFVLLGAALLTTGLADAQTPGWLIIIAAPVSLVRAGVVFYLANFVRQKTPSALSQR